MAIDVLSMLASWLPRREQSDWVLGTVVETRGPCYRKAGAMMLFSEQGEQLGLLSGGCLEADIHRQALRVLQKDRPVVLTYDGSDEDDIAYQLGIGCGGCIHILLQPVRASNQYLGLVYLYELLAAGQSARLLQPLPEPEGVMSGGAAQLHLDVPRGTSAEEFAPGDSAVVFTADNIASAQLESSHFPDENCIVAIGAVRWSSTLIVPPPRLLVFGGGVDAIPLVSMAAQMGWLVDVADSRPVNARPNDFRAARRLFRELPAEICSIDDMQGVDAVVVMQHNLAMDAAAIEATAVLSPSYIALLGPAARKQRVLDLCEHLPEQEIRGPAGLDLGGEGPESIALSILAECQACLAGKLIAQKKLTIGCLDEDKPVNALEHTV